MAEDSGHTVLPVSALKRDASMVFDSLKDGKTVYVSNRGRVVAAFRPYGFIPSGVLALHTSPYVNVATLSARDMQRGVPSSAVAEAAEGLPSIVEKSGRVFGILTPATAPSSSVPDIAAIGAKSEAVRAFQAEHPDATIDTVMDFYRQFDGHDEYAPPAHDWSLSGLFATTTADDGGDAITDDLERWRHQGSEVEGVVESIFASLDRAIPAIVDGSGVSVQLPAVPDAVAAVLRVASQPGRDTVVGGEQLEANGETVQARAHYVTALTATVLPDVGVMYRLGNLARSTGHAAEAARWFRLSFTYDALEQLEAAERR